VSKGSKAKRDKKQKDKQKKSNIRLHRKFSMPQEPLGRLDLVFDPRFLTTPDAIDDNVRDFCSSTSTQAPFFLEVRPELWCRQSNCNQNVRRYIEINGGEIICGYKIWYNKNRYIEAERHAVWRKGDEYRDITFNADGETKILFLPDIPEKQGELELGPDRIRFAITEQAKEQVKIQEMIEKQVPVEKMTEEDSWNAMISYEEWLKGKRMSSLLLGER